jgi:hypothetical protein
MATRDAQDSEFRFAKIMTLPFFGAGLVELPPSGFKRAKNSRKMHMVFFVHAGKVMVEVGASGEEGENEFAISKGGAWVVPRGELLLSFLSRLDCLTACWLAAICTPPSGARLLVSNRKSGRPRMSGETPPSELKGLGNAFALESNEAAPWFWTT